MLFEPEHYGLPISEQLSEYLKANTNSNDIAIASSKTGVSMSTIRYVAHYRTNALTEENSVAIVEMVKLAIENCKKRIEDSLKAKSFLEKLFSKVPA